MLRGALSCEYMSSIPVEPLDVARDSKDDLLDLIFSTDNRTGFPNSAIDMFLSEKTDNEVREYIKSNILMELPDNLPQGQLLDFIKSDETDASFLAQVSRNRFESAEQYETRLSALFRQYQQEFEFKKRYAELNK